MGAGPIPVRDLSDPDQGHSCDGRRLSLSRGRGLPLAIAAQGLRPVADRTRLLGPLPPRRRLGGRRRPADPGGPGAARQGPGAVDRDRGFALTAGSGILARNYADHSPLRQGFALSAAAFAGAIMAIVSLQWQPETSDYATTSAGSEAADPEAADSEAAGPETANSSSSGAQPSEQRGHKIDANNATFEQLVEVAGLRPIVAKAILD